MPLSSKYLLTCLQGQQQGYMYSHIPGDDTDFYL